LFHFTLYGDWSKKYFVLHRIMRRHS